MARELINRGTEAAVKLRPLRVPDIDRVLAVLDESAEAARWSKEGFLETLDEPGCFAFVTEHETQVSGFLIGRLISDQAEVLNLAVAQAHRRRGEGTALLNAALREIRARGGKTAYLEVRESNTGGIAFYERHGFTRVGVRKSYYQDPLESAVTMSKNVCES